MTILSVGRIEGLPSSNEITVHSKSRLTVEGILRVSTIQNSSGLTTLTSTSQGVITLTGNLTTTQNITTSSLEPSRLVTAIWTTPTRPSTPATGTFGYNETIGAVEIYSGTSWEKINGR